MELKLETNNEISMATQFMFFLTIVILFAFSNMRNLSIMIQLTFVGVILLRIINLNKIRLTPHFFWMMSFLTWGLFISLFSYNSISSVTTIINLSLKLLLYTSILFYIDSEYKFNKSLKYIIIAALVLIIRLILVTPSSAWGTDRLGTSIGLNANTIGLVLGYASIATFYLGKKSHNKLYYLLLVPFVTVALFTGSRKSFLLIILGLSSILVLYAKEKRHMIFNIFLVFSFAIGLYYLVMNNLLLYNIIGQRLEGLGILTDNINSSTATRIGMIEEGLSLIKNRPILGYGFENFRLISRYQGYSHNNYIEIAVSSGIIGLLIYYSLPVFLILSSLLKSNSNKKYIIITILTGIVLIMDFGMVSYSQLITQLMLVICTSYYLFLSNNKNTTCINA